MFEKKTVEIEKSEKKKSKSGKGFAIKSLVIPFVLAAICVCLVYIVMTNITKNEIVKTSVIRATKDIEANTFIDKKDYEKYFEQVDIDTELLSENVYKQMKDLPEKGFYVEQDLVKKQMLYKNAIEMKDAVMDKYVDGTQITSIAVDAFNNSVSGTIRHGDIVDVYAVDPSTDQLVLMVSNVYVVAAYDGSGNELTKEYELENGAQTATVFSVKVAPSEIDQMNLAISFKGIQLYLTEE